MFKLKSELAEMYNVTSRTFRRYINSGELYSKLTENGYRKEQKGITFRQYKIICEHLGEP